MRLTPNEASHLAYVAFFRCCCRMELSRGIGTTYRSFATGIAATQFGRQTDRSRRLFEEHQALRRGCRPRRSDLGLGYSGRRCGDGLYDQGAAEHGAVFRRSISHADVLQMATRRRETPPSAPLATSLRPCRWVRETLASRNFAYVFVRVERWTALRSRTRCGRLPSKSVRPNGTRSPSRRPDRPLGRAADREGSGEDEPFRGGGPNRAGTIRKLPAHLQIIGDRLPHHRIVIDDKNVAHLAGSPGIPPLLVSIADCSPAKGSDNRTRLKQAFGCPSIMGFAGR